MASQNIIFSGESQSAEANPSKVRWLYPKLDLSGNEWRMALLIVGVLWAAVTPTRCLAQVQLPSVNLGETNFEDAFGGPGWLFQEFPEAYVAGELKDSQGRALPGSNRVTTYSTTTHVAFVSEKRVLGGWLSGEVLQPLVDLDVQLANGTSSRIRGLADLTFGAGLQWAPKKIGKGVFAQRFVFDVTLPTGKYSDQRPVNIGNHFVVVNPYYALTYERKKIESSARLHFLWNSANDDPFVGFGIRTMQPGQAFHVNYAISYKVRNNVRLGFNGYWLQQVTDHRISNVDVPYYRERTVGLGPGLQLGGRDIWFRLNGYLETDVRNRPSGVKVTFRISKTLPNGSLTAASDARRSSRHGGISGSENAISWRKGLGGIIPALTHHAP
jgi:hypothetical protein